MHTDRYTLGMASETDRIESTLAPSRGGRGARERILTAAARLFYEDGINATGIERLIEVAQVSRRTFYQHFPSKSTLVVEYLNRQEAESAPRSENVLADPALGPRERLLALFDAADGERPFRGCPFHNAAVEAAGKVPAVHESVSRHKEQFIQRLIRVSEEAGAADPEALGRQMAVLFEGARALATSIDDQGPLLDARAAATTLIDAATRSGA